ncbi:hypothetical protein BX070DRAFT_189654, partial [Coemansia spiralis]
ISKPVANLHDLTDGIALFEICAEIDRQWFKSIRSADIGDNWVLKLNNLKKLYKLVTRYYEEVLGYPASNLTEPNISAIAKDGNVDELLKLCQLILTLAVQCERNQVYIGKIMSLGEEDQRSLMVSIESVLAQLGSAEPDTEPDGHDVDMMDASLANDDVDPVARLQAELMKSYAEKDELEKSARELSVEHKDIQTKYEDLLVLNEELKTRMEELERSMARADKTGKVDFLLRAEIENLRHDLEKADSRYQEVDRLNKEQTATITDLSRRLTESEEAKDEVVRALEEQLAQAQDRSRQIEEEYKRVSQLRPTMDNYRDEYLQLESRHNLTVVELSQAMERLRKLEDEKERMRHEKQRDQDLIMSLEETLRELELNRDPGAGHGSVATLDAGLESAMSSEDRVTLLTKVARLERELEEAKKQVSGTNPAEFLEEVADAANREKEQAINELNQEKEQRKRLEDELAAQAEKLHSTEIVAEESSRVKDDLKQVTSKLNKSLEGWYTETHEQSKEFKAEIDRLSAENCQLTQRLSKLQEDLTRFDIGKREIESENQRMAQALERHKVMLASTSQYSQSDVDRLQKELVKSRDEVHALQISLKRTKDHCIQLDQRLKQTQREPGAAPQDDYKEVLMSLQSQLAMKDEQLDSMRAMLREQNNVHLLESRTMASAWFNLQRQLERQSGHGGTPASWLGQQRVTLDMQLNG